jgi:hypothetical protein
VDNSISIPVRLTFYIESSFVSGHGDALRSDGAADGHSGEKELLKVPILGYGMGYVNIMAIDRSNRERASDSAGGDGADTLRRFLRRFAEGARSSRQAFAVQEGRVLYGD